MQRLEVSCAVRRLYKSLGVKWFFICFGVCLDTTSNIILLNILVPANWDFLLY